VEGTRKGKLKECLQAKAGFRERVALASPLVATLFCPVLARIFLQGCLPSRLAPVPCPLSPSLLPSLAPPWTPSRPPFPFEPVQDPVYACLHDRLPPPGSFAQKDVSFSAHLGALFQRTGLRFPTKRFFLRLLFLRQGVLASACERVWLSLRPFQSLPQPRRPWLWGRTSVSPVCRGRPTAVAVRLLRLHPCPLPQFPTARTCIATLQPLIFGPDLLDFRRKSPLPTRDLAKGSLRNEAHAAGAALLGCGKGRSEALLLQKLPVRF